MNIDRTFLLLAQLNFSLPEIVREPVNVLAAVRPPRPHQEKTQSNKITRISEGLTQAAGEPGEP